MKYFWKNAFIKPLGGVAESETVIATLFMKFLMRDDKPTEKVTLLKNRDKKNAIATLFLLVINEYGDY